MKNDLLLLAGRVAGFVGVLLCVVSGGARIAGRFWLGGFQTGTLLQLGMAVMIAACLCYLMVLTDRSGAGR
jgi:hypothetical protein